MLTLADVLRISRRVEGEVCFEKDGVCLRKYYRFRASRHYGGSAVADVVGCNLGCAYCWCRRVNSSPWLGSPEAPERVVEKLLAIARGRGYRVIRLSGGEPTLCLGHLLQVLDSFSRARLGEVFVLETNGLMLSLRSDALGDLARYADFLHVRVSLKGCSAEEFSAVTGVDGSVYDYQITLLKRLDSLGLAYSIAVPISFCTRRSLSKLLERLVNLIGEHVANSIEFETLVLYPSSIAGLCKKGLRPWIALDLGRGAKVKGEELERLLRERCGKHD